MEEENFSIDAGALPYERIQNHADTLLVYLQQLKQQEKFVDVLVQSDGITVCTAHRLLLAAYSKHFETALAGVRDSTIITLDVDPKITGVESSDLVEMVNFIYSGRVCTDTTKGLLEPARSLGCSSLIQLLESDEVALPNSITIEDSSHSQRLLRASYRYKTDARFTDCVINCQNTPVLRCHRLILSAFSSHFENALENTDDCALVTVDIDSAVTGISSTDVRIMVDFMYTGFVRTARKRFPILRHVAVTLGVTRLVNVIDEEMMAAASQTLQLFPSNLNGDCEDLIYGDDMVTAIGDTLCNADQLPVDMAFDQSNHLYQASDLSLLGNVDSLEEASDRQLTAGDDYSDIYEEYVSGPRRGRRGGSYGRRHDAVSVKSQQSKIIFDQAEDGCSSASFFENGNFGFDGPIPAVTMSFMPSGKRRRATDSFGYGLPEIIGPNDITVPLLVGDQQAMMEKPFKCPYCDHRTKEKSAVEKHVRCIHTHEAPYKCAYCNQAFKVQSNLVRHIRAHTGEKPYVCKKCGTAYADKKNMDAHVFREHLKTKPVECPETGCSAKFWRQDRLEHHYKKAHGPPQLASVS